MKKCQFRLVSGVAILFFVLYFQVVLQYGVNKTLLDKTVAVLTFIGIAATIMATIPVMTAIFSYKDFKQNFIEANDKLNTLNLDQKYLKDEVGNFLEKLEIKEKKLEKLLKEHNEKEKKFNLLYRYVFNENISEEERGWINLFIDIKNLDIGYRLFSILAKFKQDENVLYEENAIWENRKFNEDLITLWLKTLPYYKILAELEPKALQEYCHHIRYILNQYVKTYDINDEVNECIKQLIFELIKEDEFCKFNYNWDENLINSLNDANKKLNITYSDLEKHHLINKYNFRQNRLSDTLKNK